ncbi:MAG: diguanylate cyclase [Chloroflexi bacterium]|nr:diguanylate cyclase [Chloroflexota bacterium]
MIDSNQALEKQLRELRDAYAQALPDRIQNILVAWQTLQANWEKASLRALYRLVHSLAGSGATFGFRALSSAARESELYLQGLLENPHLPSSEQITQISALVQEIKRAAEIQPDEIDLPALTVLPSPSVTIPEHENHLIYLIEGDPALATILVNQLSPFGYVLRIFRATTDGDPALKKDFPEAIVLDASVQESLPRANEILAQIRLAHPNLPLIVIASRGDFPSRLHAARMGSNAYFTKPIEISALTLHLDMLTAHKAPEPYRILIIEDDKDLAEHNAAILCQAGMKVHVVTDPTIVTPALIEFNPGLILMDLYMPTVSGLELAAVIRQQEAFVSIPIVFLSAVANPDIQLAAMRLGADDFLAKPIQADHLISSVSSRAQRYTSMRYYMTRDSLTGLLNHTATEERVEIEVSRARRANTKLAYVMIDIDHFKLVNDTYGHPVGDRVLKNLSRLLQQRFRKADVIGRYGGEEFALVLPDTDGPTAVKILDDLREAFGKIRHQADEKEFSITFSAGIAVYPPYGDAVKLNDTADKALYLAKNRGRNQIVLAG